MGRIVLEKSFPFVAKTVLSSSAEDTNDDCRNIRLLSQGSCDSEDRSLIIDTHGKVEHVELSVDQAEYLPAPWWQKNGALPHIPGEIVRTRDGKEGRKLWIVVDNVVLDCTDYRTKHPGGSAIIEGFGGQDCSWQWWSFHSEGIMDKQGRGLRVGWTSGIENQHEKPQRKAFKLATIGERW